MNKFLASAIGFAKGLLAFFLIAGGGLFGTLLGIGTIANKSGIDLPAAVASPLVFGILGTFIGLFFAIAICGFMSVMIDIRNELATIRKSLENK